MLRMRCVASKLAWGLNTPARPAHQQTAFIQGDAFRHGRAHAQHRALVDGHALLAGPR